MSRLSFFYKYQVRQYGGWVGGATAYLGGATAYLVGGATAYLGGATAYLVGGKMNPRIRLTSAKVELKLSLSLAIYLSTGLNIHNNFCLLGQISTIISVYCVKYPASSKRQVENSEKQEGRQESKKQKAKKQGSVKASKFVGK